MPWDVLFYGAAVGGIAVGCTMSALSSIKAARLRSVAAARPLPVLSRAQRLVIAHMSPDFSCPAANIAIRACLPEYVVRAAFREMKFSGVVDLGFRMADDGEMRGRGYFLTDYGASLKSAILAVNDNPAMELAA